MTRLSLTTAAQESFEAPIYEGDLGGPILERQREIASASFGGTPQEIQTTVETERQRLAAELKAAHESGLLVTTSDRNGSASIASSGAAINPPQAAAVEVSTPPVDLERDPNAQTHKREFVDTIDQGSDINPHGLVPPASPYLLSAGSVIAASLITGLRSDLPPPIPPHGAG